MVNLVTPFDHDQSFPMPRHVDMECLVKEETSLRLMKVPRGTRLAHYQDSSKLQSDLDVREPFFLRPSFMLHNQTSCG